MTLTPFWTSFGYQTEERGGGVNFDNPSAVSKKHKNSILSSLGLEWGCLVQQLHSLNTLVSSGVPKSGLSLT